MTDDRNTPEDPTPAGDEPTVVVVGHDPEAGRSSTDRPLWGDDGEHGNGAAPNVDAAGADAEAGASGKSPGAKQRVGGKAGEARDRAASFAASARERAANTDVKELAASTTSLIDTARPFFLAFFGALFTILAFVGGDNGTSQLFVVGAILFVLAAGFSAELGHVVPVQRHRKERDPAGSLQSD